MLGLSALLLAAATPAIVEQTGPHILVAGPIVVQSLTYGPEPRQGLELFTRERAGRGPLIVYLHGGGWSAGSPRDGARGAQAEHWTSLGYAYATVAYRYVPIVTAEEQLRDIAKAIAFLRRQRGVDGRRIILIGHSSGATMAAQLGTDPQWLEGARVPFADLKAVVLLDPSVLDIAPLMAAAEAPAVERYFRPAFGDDPVRWSQLSPIKQVGARDAPAWAILTDANNVFAAAQGGDFAAALIGAGAKEARVTPIPDTSHMQLNNQIGQTDDRATAAIDAFLARALPEMQRPRFR
ncbi:alpha/beta hydrolase [Sphingomonas sp. ID1715]|uniref:alpha/beta hydrolase n=1 Tax=Sphingomonas sp. ID1715 TaxID=1656898 RepID=UPI00148910DD|nr:alpha/beta hydrolase [Sphingomonas sp. ID1715]NNM77054.1 alpha/beta hydrolase [Sphingomonas sp. ID1715]